MSSSTRDLMAIFERLEQIITLYNERPGGLSTKELYELMQRIYGYDQTIENLRKTYLPLLEKGAIKGVSFTPVLRGRHKLIDRRFTGTALDEENRTYIKLALETVENLEDISKEHPEVCQKLSLDELEIPFYIKAQEWQKLDTDDEEIGALENAILHRNIIAFSYKGRDYHVEPYRLVNFEGIWYLYGRDIEEHTDNDHKTWMLEFIDDVEVFHSDTHNVSEEQIEEVLEEARHPLFNPDVRIDVELFVHKEIADVVKLKEFFPKQKILDETPEGIRLRSTVSTYAEITDEIKTLLPHVRILSPETLREQIVNDLQSWLTNT